jgi:acetate kinase
MRGSADLLKIANHGYILTMNVGSSSLKSALYQSGSPSRLHASITADLTEGATARLKIADAEGSGLLDCAVKTGGIEAALGAIFDWLSNQVPAPRFVAAGHRLVHGGEQYREPQRISAEFLSKMEKLLPLDPDHLPGALRGIRFIREKFPDLPQVACFDTAFHRSLPKVARRYALPRHLSDEGIFRYGFHGLSYESIMLQLRSLETDLWNGRIVIAHLGSGASIAAIKNGESRDTSMGFTPLEGLVMGTRSGDVDPGALLYLMTQKKMSAATIDKLLNKESGLLGVSGTSADMRKLLEKAATDEHAAEAVDLFCYRAKKYIGSYAAVLGGLDVLVFAGGIGEHAPQVRRRICEGLDFLGVRLDDARNRSNEGLISSAEGRVKVRVVKTDEDQMILRHVDAVLGPEAES